MCSFSTSAGISETRSGGPVEVSHLHEVHTLNLLSNCNLCSPPVPKRDSQTVDDEVTVVSSPKAVDSQHIPQARAGALPEIIDLTCDSPPSSKRRLSIFTDGDTEIRPGKRPRLGTTEQVRYIDYSHQI
jgi:hypothetical protein